MNKSPKNFHIQFPDPILLYSLVAFGQFMIAGLFTLTISPDPKNAALFGFSIQRLALLMINFILAGLFLGAGLIAHKRKKPFGAIYEAIQTSHVKALINGIIFVLIIWGWLSIFCPSYLFGKSAEYYERVQPLSIALGLSVFEFWLLSIITQKKTDFRIVLSHIDRKNLFPILVFAIGGIGLASFTAVTKIGLVLDTAYWNVPGIPLSGLQIFFMVILIGLGIYNFSMWTATPTFWQKNKLERIFPLLIFLLAIFAWGLAPMLKHFYSLQPIFPNYQPYPFSDARIHDLGGISILRGNGIYFHDYTDKPLYMVFLSVLHIFAGNDYSLLSWLQIIVLALIPVLLFYFGKKFHGVAFGIFLSLIIIIRQQNAILQSNNISSVNPKLLLTETITLLGIILFTYLVFLWFRTKKTWLSFLSGGVIGAVSLIRLNPLLLFPAIACLMLPVFWKSPPNIIRRHLSLYTLGLLILMLPWIITGVNPDGKPWILIKFLDVINVRYGQTINPRNALLIPSPYPTGTSYRFQSSSISPVAHKTSVIPFNQEGSLWGQNAPSTGLNSALLSNVQKSNESAFMSKTAFLLLNHFLHNISTSVLALPDSLVYDNLDTLSQREYWQDLNKWNGDFPIAQAGLVFVNLLLIAVGLGYSWRRYGWAGLAPIFIFLAYCLSLAFAMNSGGRYIVPIDWIIYFYYALALVLIINFMVGFFNKKENDVMKPPKIGNAQHISDRKAFWLSLVGLLCLASLIPIANLVVPAISDLRTKQIEIDSVKKIIAIDPQKGESLVFGEILYPYYGDNSTVDFDLVTDHGSDMYTINGNQLLVNNLLDANQVVVRLGSENGNQRVESIYQLRNSSPELIWEDLPK